MVDLDAGAVTALSATAGEGTVTEATDLQVKCINAMCDRHRFIDQVSGHSVAKACVREGALIAPSVTVFHQMLHEQRPCNIGLPR